MKTLHVFGNPYLQEDNLALQVAPLLSKKATLNYCKSPDDLLGLAENEMNILDVVRGISEPIKITNIDDLKTRKLTSLHDFDVGYFLTLLKNLGMAKKITIMGIPQTGNLETISKKVISWL